MKMNKTLSVCLAVTSVITMGLTGCGNGKTASKEHEAVTILSPFCDVEKLAEIVHKTYPEVNVEILSYSGDDMTAYLQDMLEADDMPDICVQTVYDPGITDVSDKMIDLSSYDFTDNYVESRLRDVTTEDGAIYMLPSAYTCFGITYNKTLLEKYGWTLPQNFAEFKTLAEEAGEAGVRLCTAQIQYPGYGFQYLCNIADTGFLSTLDGKKWQNDYLSGKTNVSNNEAMMESMAYVEKWKDIGMLDAGSSDPADDAKTKETFLEGNTLFMLGMLNGASDADGTEDEFGLMPYLSEDGKQNVYILNVKRYYGLNKKLEANPQKLEDALKVMSVLSTVEGTSALYDESTLKSYMLPFKDATVDDSYFGEIADVINAGNTAPFIYTGWENAIVSIGNKMLEFMQGQASIEDVVRQLDEDQERIVNHQPEVFTTVTEEISQENCAKLVGRCFAEATDSDAALISLGTWISGNGNDQNKAGLSGKLYAMDMTEAEICMILPTGWTGTIKTIRLTGNEIRELCESGYDRFDNGTAYPYVLVTPSGLEDDKTYKTVICGISDKVASEHEVTDTGVVGMTAAKEFFGKFDTLSEKDAEWK